MSPTDWRIKGQVDVVPGGLTVEDPTTVVTDVLIAKFTSGATVTQDMTNPRQANIAVSAGGGGFRGASIREASTFMGDASNDGAQTVASGHVATVSLTHVTVDTDSFYTSAGTFKIPAATGDGLYRLTAKGDVAAVGATTGHLYCYFQTSAATGNHDTWLAGMEIPWQALDGRVNDGDINIVTITADYDLVTDDEVFIWVENQLDVDVDIGKGGTNTRWRFTIEFLVTTS